MLLSSFTSIFQAPGTIQAEEISLSHKNFSLSTKGLTLQPFSSVPSICVSDTLQQNASGAIARNIQKLELIESTGETAGIDKSAGMR
jgi:hypothetical protein